MRCESLSVYYVEQEYKTLSGKTPQVCIKEASEFCSKELTHQGVFFEVSVSAYKISVPNNVL